MRISEHFWRDFFEKLSDQAPRPHSGAMRGSGGRCPIPYLIPSDRPFKNLVFRQAREACPVVDLPGCTTTATGQRTGSLGISHGPDEGHTGKEAAQETLSCCSGRPPGRAKTPMGSVCVDQMVRKTGFYQGPHSEGSQGREITEETQWDEAFLPLLCPAYSTLTGFT